MRPLTATTIVLALCIACGDSTPPVASVGSGQPVLHISTAGDGMVTQRQDGRPFYAHWKQRMGLDARRPARIQITRQRLPKPCRIGHEPARINGMHDRLY